MTVVACGRGRKLKSRGGHGRWYHARFWNRQLNKYHLFTYLTFKFTMSIKPVQVFFLVQPSIQMKCYVDNMAFLGQTSRTIRQKYYLKTSTWHVSLQAHGWYFYWFLWNWPVFSSRYISWRSSAALVTVGGGLEPHEEDSTLSSRFKVE